MQRSTFLAAVLLLPLPAAPALAQCVEDPANTYVCSGPSEGFTDNSDAVSVTVNPGATVSRATGDGLRLRGTGSTVVNNGTIEGTGPGDGTDGIDGGDNLTVTNNGTITATSRGIDVDARNNVKIINTGTITAQNKAIRNQDGLNGELYNSGTIYSATNEGYESGDFAEVINSGTIEAQDDAVQVGQNATIINSGTIRSFANVDPLGEQQDGIDLDSGTILNTETGIIESEGDAAIDFDASIITSVIENYGRISGTTGILVDKGEDDPADANTASQIVLNHGIIEGYDGLTVDLGAGDDVLSLFGGSTLIGGADMGDDDDTLNLFDDLAGRIAGGAVLSGGAGLADTVDFKNLTLANLFRAWGNGSVLNLVLKTPASSYSVALSDWEIFVFGSDSYDRDQVLAAAPVPLPAAGLLMIAGLGGLALLRRRG
jgi:hypothetical protein